ncbi:sensor histidine kinase [Rhodopirellula baltica]|uniref:histidine kinase n=1 Tax=Rhodopirellula baltica WH47 TaxID=991778 RepID=F2AL52_RHOBT|nr:ATP-binding protein [Rhodopirellula baltica]EGF29636.1 membrane protein containing ATP-binding region, ATPase-like domains [Rhodopirellula baltica WH47]
MNTMISRLIGRTLRQRIYLASACFVLLCVLVAWFGITGQSALLKSFAEYQRAENTSVAIESIERKVQELKSRSERYLLTGASAQYRAALSLQDQLAEEIERAKGETPAIQDTLDQMEGHLNVLSDQLKLAAEERDLRSQLVQIELPEKAKRVREAFNALRAEWMKSPVEKEPQIRQHGSARGAYVSAHRSLLEYFNHPKSESFDLASQHLEKSRSVCVELKENPANQQADIQLLMEELLASLSEFQRVGTRAFQATRGYMVYSNVVMAGEISEFSYQSSRLKSYVQEQKALNQRNREASFRRSQYLAVGAAMGAVLLAILLATSLSMAVVGPIGRLTEMFRRLAAGETMAISDEIGRTEEIAQMVNAARVFSDKNQETTQLLIRSETLSEELAKKADALVESNKELDNFAYIASHDLKSPLRGIQHLASWVQEDCEDILPETSQTHLAHMQSRVRNMECLLDDLLNYSRVGRVDARPEIVDCSEVVSGIVEMADNSEDCQISWESLPTCSTVRTPLKQVLLNLITNAIKYNDKGAEGRVRVKCVQEANWYRWEISDNGIGIEPRFHEKVFQMYQRVAPEVSEGSGMGLAIAKKHVEHYGGEIGIQSSPGEGTTFWFTWPVQIETVKSPSNGELAEDPIANVPT